MSSARAWPAALTTMRARAALAIASGALLPCAFAPYGWWPIAMLAPAALLLLIAHVSVRHAALLGWCWGIGLFGHGVWWIQVSVHQFGVPYYAFSITVTALFILGMAGYIALFTFLLMRLPWPVALRNLLIAPFLWVVIEALRASLFSGFPWLALGYSQIDAPLAGLAPIGGVPLVSLGVMLLAGGIAQASLAGWRQRSALLVAVITLLASGAALRGQEWTHAAGEPREVVLVQGAIPQQQKWVEELRQAALARYLDLSKNAWDADLIVWPETAIPAFAAEIPAIIEELQARAATSGAALLVGMPTGEPWNGRYFNSVVQFGPQRGQYDKRHLVPFGEFFPLAHLLRDLVLLFSIPMSNFSAGDAAQAPIEVAGFRAGISICFEDAFPQAVKDARPLPDFLVNVSNDAWFGDTIAPHQHLEIARMRALEIERYLLRSTNTGISAVIDHRGTIVSYAPQFVATSLRERFEPRRGNTPYARIGDRPLLALAFVLLVAAVCYGGRRSAQLPASPKPDGVRPRR